MDETTYLDAPGATVTSSRIVIGSQTFATRNVGSVAVQEVAKPRWPIFAIVIGGLIALGTQSSGFSAATVVGLALAGGGAMVLFSPTKLRLKLMAGGGEVVALESTDQAAVNTLHQAIVKAIAAR